MYFLPQLSLSFLSLFLWFLIFSSLVPFITFCGIIAIVKKEYQSYILCIYFKFPQIFTPKSSSYSLHVYMCMQVFMHTHVQHLSQESLSYSGLLVHNNKSTNTEASASWRAKDCFIHSDLSVFNPCWSSQASASHPSGPVPALGCSLTKCTAHCAHSLMPWYTGHCCHLLLPLSMQIGWGWQESTNRF